MTDLPLPEPGPFQLHEVVRTCRVCQVTFPSVAFSPQAEGEVLYGLCEPHMLAEAEHYAKLTRGVVPGPAPRPPEPEPFTLKRVLEDS